MASSDARCNRSGIGLGLIHGRAPPPTTLRLLNARFGGLHKSDSGFGIDDILFSPDRINRLAHASVDRHVRRWDKACDHAPVWIELKE